MSVDHNMLAAFLRREVGTLPTRARRELLVAYWRPDVDAIYIIPRGGEDTNTVLHALGVRDQITGPQYIMSRDRYYFGSTDVHFMDFISIPVTGTPARAVFTTADEIMLAHHMTNAPSSRSTIAPSELRRLRRTYGLD